MAAVIGVWLAKEKKKLKVYSHGILIVAVQFLNIKKYSDVHTRLKTHFKYGEVKIDGV